MRRQLLLIYILRLDSGTETGHLILEVWIASITKNSFCRIDSGLGKFCVAQAWLAVVRFGPELGPNLNRT
jgi:hypothetical protein